LTQYRSVTDGWTDGQTDRQTDDGYALAYTALACCENGKTYRVICLGGLDVSRKFYIGDRGRGPKAQALLV